MERREFVKRVGLGGLLVGLVSVAGLGCPEDPVEEPPLVDPDPPIDDPEPPVEDPPEPPVDDVEEDPE